MTQHDLLNTLEDGLNTQRISPYLVAYIAAEVLNVDARSTGYDDRIRLDETVDLDLRPASLREYV